MAKPAFIIPAKAWSDDRKVEVDFDALPFFEHYAVQPILDLAEGDWAIGYPADAVALFCVERGDEDLRFLWRYMEATDPGFEVEVDEDKAMAWLQDHRPDVHNQILAATKEDQ